MKVIGSCNIQPFTASWVKSVQEQVEQYLNSNEQVCKWQYNFVFLQTWTQTEIWETCKEIKQEMSIRSTTFLKPS